jgi:hypothetical protein
MEGKRLESRKREKKKMGRGEKREIFGRAENSGG